jgi:hypothetical protein
VRRVTNSTHDGPRPAGGRGGREARQLTAGSFTPAGLLAAKGATLEAPFGKPAWSPFLPHYFCHFRSSKMGKLTAGDHGSRVGIGFRRLCDTPGGV